MKKSTILTFTLFLSSIVFVFAQNQTVLWSDDFEGDWTADWHTDAGTWEVGIPTSGPSTTHSGEKCAATVLDGDYSEPVATRLIRHSPFVVPAATENPRFRYWYWFSFNSPGDWGEVQISIDGGNTWESISNKIDNRGSDAWSYGSIDISAYAGSTVQLAFYFQSVKKLNGTVM